MPLKNINFYVYSNAELNAALKIAKLHRNLLRIYIHLINWQDDIFLEKKQIKLIKTVKYLDISIIADYD